MSGLWRALTANTAGTDPAAKHRDLRGRTYAIPFETVWSAALALASGGLPRWRVARADDQEGIIEAESTTLVFRFVDDVRVEIGLDENAQTRVDVHSASRVGRGDLGRNARTIRRFARALDRAVGATPALVLDPGGPERG